MSPVVVEGFATPLRHLCTAALLLLVSSCGGDGDACFGLCSKANDRSSSSPEPDSGVDRSCYSDGSLEAAETLPYASTFNNPGATLLYQGASAASFDNLRPLLIWITGNTWRTSNAAEDAPSIARSLATELGAHLARLNYRDADDTQWPEPIIDVNTAVRFLRGQAASRNIDPERIIIAGDQAGAHLAALAASAGTIQEFIGDDNLSQPGRVDALIALGGVYDFANLSADADAIVSRCGDQPALSGAAVRRLFNCAAPATGAAALSECDANELQQASPVFNASSDDPPALIWHGSQDCRAPAQQSERLHERLTDQSTQRHQLTLLADDDDGLTTLRASDIEIELAQSLPCEDDDDPDDGA